MNADRPDDPEFYRDLAERLRVAHRLAEALPSDVRIVFIRRLLALAELVKRDPYRASRRLDRLLAELGEQQEEPPTR